MPGKINTGFLFPGEVPMPGIYPGSRKGEVVMKKIIKIIITIVLLVAGLILLTYFRLFGIHFLCIHISSEAVNVFVDSMGTYFYFTYVAIILLVFWGFWIGRAIFKKKKDKS